MTRIPAEYGLRCTRCLPITPALALITTSGKGGDGMLPVWNGAQPVHPGHVTWYHIASNAKGRAVPAAPAPLDVVFLPGLLAREAGAALDDWLAANLVAGQACGGAFTGCTAPRTRDAYLSYLLHDLDAFARR